jgi:hypothetical protein
MRKWVEIAGLFLLMIPFLVKAQDYTYTVSDDTVTITKYVGSGGTVTIPNILSGFPVTSIGSNAFYYCTPLTSVTIGNSVTNIGDSAFQNCTGLTNVVIGGSVTNISNWAFSGCTKLANVTMPDHVVNIGNYAFNLCGKLLKITIPDSVINIGYSAFYGCGLVNVTIPANVISINSYAFYGCGKLTSVYFKGNAPVLGDDVFVYIYNAFVYCLPGTAGYGAMFGGLPVVEWSPQIQTGDASFGLSTSGFGFSVSGDANYSVVVEACTNLASGSWVSIQTNTLNGGSAYFCDMQWTNYPGRFYRMRMP